MWKALFLAVTISVLVWLGLLEDQNSGSNSPLFDRVNSWTSEFSSKGLDQGKELVESAIDTINPDVEQTESDSDKPDTNSAKADAKTQGTASDGEQDSAESSEADTSAEDTTATAAAETDTADTNREAVDNPVADSDTGVSDNAATDEVTETQKPLSLSGLSRKIGSVIGSTTSLLSGVSDADTATAALPILTSVSESLSQVAQSVPTIPDLAKAPLSKLISSGIDRIKPLTEQAISNPGVADVLQPVLEPMMETLKGLVQ